MLTKLDRLKIGQWIYASVMITFSSRNRSLWKHGVLLRTGLFPTVQLYSANRNIGYRKLDLPVFCPTRFLGGQSKSSGSSEYPHPLQVLCRVAGSVCGQHFPDPALWSQSQQLVTIGCSMLHRIDHQENWMLLWNVIAFLFTRLIKGIVLRDKYNFRRFIIIKRNFLYMRW